ncbi:tetratricopeptide repeat protein [Paenibacillus protaetiae]|nr:tetratricopeptide repeat protein [Paenibacillus protaetiae]
MDGEACIRKAYDYILNADFEKAIYWFEQAIAAEPGNAGYCHRCAVSCARSGKWEKAKTYAARAVELEPNNEEYLYYWSTIEAKLSVMEADKRLNKQPPDLDGAVMLLKLASERDPISFEAWYMLALAYSEQGRLEEAAASAREALRLDYGHSAARRLFADLKRKLRQQAKNEQLGKGKR